MNVNTKKLIQLGLIAVLGVAVYLDYFPDEDEVGEIAFGATETDQLQVRRQQKIEIWSQAIKSKKQVNSAYQSIALDYAEQMAPLATFILDDSKPKTVAESVVRSLAVNVGAGELRSLMVGEPIDQGDGVYNLSASIDLEFSSHQNALRALNVLGDPRNGTTWKSYEMVINENAMKISLLGELQLIAVRAAE
ncbi:MAG: hypothetical protein L3J79_12130 [Candidatus Marinimicrobia bacterium]|nr:hypothetical protein [Candidatus Neomarinimicrobiota bacterium]